MKNETSEKAALRILKEKTGVKNVYFEQLYTFDSLSRDPRGHVLTVSYFALIDRNKIQLRTGAFHNANALPSLAFDHKKIIAYALKRLGYKLEYTNLVFSLLPEKFTFGQLQNAYQIILGKKLDKRNFRKKFMALNLIKSVKAKAIDTGHRPAQFYAFISRKPLELKRFF